MRYFIIFTITLITKVGAQSPTFVVADSLFQLGNYSKAIEVYEQFPENPQALVQIAKSYKALGNSQKAIKQYEMILKNDDASVLIIYDYGKLLFSEGKHEKSIKIFESLLQNDPKNPNFHYYLGLNQEVLQAENYVNSFLAAYRLDSQHQKSIYKLIKFYIEQQAYQRAEKFIAYGLKNNDEDVKILGFQAQLLYAQQKYRAALKIFEKLIEKRKATQYSYEKAAYAAYKINDILKAIAYYEEALKREPGNYFYHSQLAKLYYYDGIAEKAQHHASQSLAAKMIDTSGDYYILGMIAFDKRDYKSAMKFFKIALKENPDYVAAQFQLALASDSYFASLKEKLKGHELFMKKFPNADERYTKIIKARIRELKSEIHMRSE